MISPGGHNPEDNTRDMMNSTGGASDDVSEYPDQCLFVSF